MKMSRKTKSPHQLKGLSRFKGGMFSREKILKNLLSSQLVKKQFKVK